MKVSLSQLKKQLTALQEGTLGIFQAQLKAKEEEVQKLSTILSSSQKGIMELEEELVHVQKRKLPEVGEIEDKLNKN